MRKALRFLISFVLLFPAGAPIFAQTGPSILTRVAGKYMAANYNSWRGSVVQGVSVTGAGTIIVSNPGALADGRVINPYSVTAPISVDGETETPTTVSATACPTNGGSNGCTAITATWTAIHPGGQLDVTSGTFGLQEAINDAFGAGGGIVSIDNTFGGTNATLVAALPYASVVIEDDRNADIQYWRPTQALSTTLATPAVLTTQAACDATHTTCSDATAVGTWTAAAYYFCVAYVDVMGNEGTCSTTANFTAVVSKAVDVAAPVASAGAVGYTIYGGVSYAAATQVPITSLVCTPTKIETVTPACALTNATYGQTGSNAQIAAITVTTSPLALNATTTSSTTDYVGNPNARTVYLYAPSHRVGLSGIMGSSYAFPVGAAAATTVPNVIGTLAVPPGYMNFVGRSIEICGYATEASAGSTATISNIQLWWDAAGSDTATGVPILIGTNPSTNTLVTAKTDQFEFCYDLRTTVAGAGVTAGSIIQDNATYINQYTSSGVATVPVVALGQAPAAVASLNLAGGAGFTTRIHVVYLHTTGTDGAGVQLQNLTVKELN